MHEILSGLQKVYSEVSSNITGCRTCSPKIRYTLL